MPKGMLYWSAMSKLYVTEAGQLKNTTTHNYVNLSSPHHGPTTLNRDANRGLPLPQLPGRQPNYMLKNSQAFLNLRAGDK
jgi:hypothetical protein